MSLCGRCALPSTRRLSPTSQLDLPVRPPSSTSQVIRIAREVEPRTVVFPHGGHGPNHAVGPIDRAELAVAGGRDPDGIPAALDQVRALLG